MTELLTANEGGIARAADLLRRGGTVAFPTETVYGLGADATNARAVAGIYAAKERPSFNPLISHLPDLAAAQAHGRFDADATALAEAFWPGPLTLVVPKAAGSAICDLVSAGLDTVALRVPAHPLAHDLLRRVGRPVAAPSANRSGRISPTQADHVLADLIGRIDALIDGGSTQVGLESTIVACIDGHVRLLRPGGVPREAIEGVLGRRLAAPPAAASETEASVLAPGMLASHYAPRAKVRLDARTIEAGEAVLLFGPGRPRGLDAAAAVLNLSRHGDPVEAAAHLFAHLHALDASGAATIAVVPIPDKGLGEAINDRLRRAAAPR
ncbi:L-threonylcarbamoyladenylate synthase [Chelatococcus sp. SYSU_G07232]|uniref:Threonylcarbamoyl-AMP synthase n=1 Tax=Chelatococcus albus TaxID=3047466 RepID=A0ABT7AEL5_9HYPH|nr:L-threonylcarbamoyladenylate synthase [Chelatococcus sp. SYSU_G07232]MDJ1157793.1 L-threonylcarbamoyladenylate synthase [Chelatococcus sp. SYSU_G07232]